MPFDDRGNALSPSHAVKNKKRYRYYVNQALIQFRPEDAGAVKRIAAHEIESLVSGYLLGLLNEPSRLLEVLQANEASVELQSTLRTQAAALAEGWEAMMPTAKKELLRASVSRITASQSEVQIEIDRPGLAATLGISKENVLACGATGSVCVAVDARFKRLGGETRLILGGTLCDSPAGHPDAKIVEALAHANKWARDFETTAEFSIRKVAAEAGYSETRAFRILRLAYLAPDIVEAILAGRQPRRLSLRAMLQGVPQSWNEQRLKFGFPPP